MKGYQHRWLAGGYDLEIGHLLEVASMVVTWWIVAFLHGERLQFDPDILHRLRQEYVFQFKVV